MKNAGIIFTVLFLVSAFAFAEDPLDYNNLSDYYGFGEMEVIKLSPGVIGLKLEDINSDGKNDIIIPNNSKARIEVFTQTDTLKPSETSISVDPQDFEINAINPLTRFKRQPIAVSQRIYSLAIGDLNKDGLKDLAFYGEPKGLYIILQKRNEADGEDGKLSWKTRKKIQIADGLLTPHSVVCSDLNNDGRDDLVVTARDSVYLITQKEDGTLAEPVKYPSTSQIKGVDSADMGGDGNNDLFMITDDIEKPVQIRFGSANGQLGPQVPFFAVMPWSVELFDIDGKGGVELLEVDSVSGRLLCYKLLKEQEKDTDWPIVYYPLASGEGSSKRDLVVGDLNGDGLDDVVISDPGAAEIIMYAQRENLGLAEPKNFPAFTDIDTLNILDIDDDSKMELGVISVKEKAIGISQFEDDRLSFPEPLDVQGEPLAMELADIDSDGKADCVYVAKDVNQVRWLNIIYNVNSKLGAKSGLEADEELSILEDNGKSQGLKLKKLSSNPDGIKVVDCDQDGLKDVLIFDKYNPPPLFARQVRKGTFELVTSAKAQSSLIKEATGSSLSVVDINQKKGSELLVAQNNFARSLIFSDSKKWRIVDQYNAKSKENKINAVEAFYLNGLGLTDQPAILLLDGQKGQLQILKPSEDKTYRFEKQLDVGKWRSAAHLKMVHSSLMGTGSKDILLFDSEKFAIISPPTSTNQPYQLEQQFSYETKIKDGVYGRVLAGDINSDERVDIIMLEYKGSHIEILALDPEYNPVPAMRFKIFEEKSYREGTKRSRPSVEPREIRLSDVTGDGKNDLIMVIHDRIIIYPQD